MAGEMNLRHMLSTLTVSRRPGTFTMVTIKDGPPSDNKFRLGEGVEALITEVEGTTAVLSQQKADRLGIAGDFRAVWLTLGVHSSLDAVGLTAAVADALADENIPCNVLAGFYHDHLLIPVDKADRALQRLSALQTESAAEPLAD